MKPVRIVIFAKAPQPGFAKTRLIPALGAQGAADLARRMLMRTLNEAIAAKVGQVELCVTPSSIAPIWQTFGVPEAVQWSEQQEGDLGERLATAAQRVLENGESVLLIGADCPELGRAYLQQAARALQRSDATLFPTFDGGYALLGLNYFHRSLFEGIAWSTDTVASETRYRIAQLGWTLQNHPTLHDVDVPSDLKWFSNSWLEMLRTPLQRG